MRRISIVVLLLWAVSLGTQAWAAEAHGKTVAKTRTSAHQTSSKNSVKTSGKSARRSAGKTVRSAGRRTKARTAARKAVRKASYTTEKRSIGAAVTPGAEEEFAAGYKKGYEAGLAAAHRQFEREGASATLTGTDATRREPLAGRIPAAGASAGPSEAKSTAHIPALSETTETEIPETPPIEQVAAFHVTGTGVPAPLRGSLASLERQNDRVEADGLERILDDADLDNRIAHKLLVPLPASSALTVNPGLPENRRYCRPWTALFLADMARAHAKAFHKPIQVNSAVRTVDYQKRLQDTNGNAAAAEGDIVSPHLTGATIDVAKRGLSRKEIAWMRRQLSALQKAGKIDVEEEFAQACFHITVYKSYAPSLPSHRKAAPEQNRLKATEQKTEKPGSRNPASHLPENLAVGILGPQGR